MAFTLTHFYCEMLAVYKFAYATKVVESFQPEHDFYVVRPRIGRKLAHLVS